MRYTLISLSLFAGLAVSATDPKCDPKTFELKPYDGETTTDLATIKKLDAYLKDNLCVKQSDGKESPVWEQCKNVCSPGETQPGPSQGAVVSSQSCVFGGAPWYPLGGGDPLLCGADKNFKGLMIKPGHCVCNDPIVAFVGNFFIESIQKINEVLIKALTKIGCVLLHALDIVIGIGMAALPPPGKAVSAGMMTAIRSAKAYKYVYEAQDAAQQWADFFLGGFNLAKMAGCSPLIPSRDDLIKKAFGPLSDALDEVIPGGMNYDQIQCPPKGCRGCRGPKCRNNDNKSQGNPASKSSNVASKTNNVASTTKVDVSTTKNDASKTTNTGSATSNIKSTMSTITSGSINQPTQNTGVSKSSATSFTSQSTPASTTSSSSLSSSTTATPTINCKALGVLDNEAEPPESEARKRSYPIDFVSKFLEKRGDKSGKACGVDLHSFNYPASGEWEGITSPKPKKYGFNIRDDCENYDWDKPDTGSDVLYETEHVLEWQIVVNFFDYMNKQITTKFDHPNPNKKEKVDFCTYWKESWEFTRSQVMDGPISGTPNSPTPGTPVPGSPTPGSPVPGSPTPGSPVPGSPTPGSPVTVPQKEQRSPFNWLASQYPHKTRESTMWLEELTLLERKINGENKGKIFSLRETKTSKVGVQIRDKEQMEKLVKGTAKGKFRNNSPEEQAAIVVQRLRQMVGVFKYMQEPNVAAIFAKEKKRMGAIITHIDKELHKTPRKYIPRGSDEITFTPWKEQGLGEWWNKYMDWVFETTKKKATDFMTMHLANLEEEWNSQKKKDPYAPDPKDDDAMKKKKEGLKKLHKGVLDRIEKARKEWDKVKDWKKPEGW